MKKFLKVAGWIANVALVLIVASAALLAFAARRSGDAIPTILGKKVMTVISGSMEPAIHTGDVIVARPITQADVIKEGDIVTFRSREKTDMLVTHRVLGVISINGKPRAYVTKGDANQSPDLTPVAIEQLVGLYEWRLPYFGYVATFVRTPAGIIVMVVLPGLVLIGQEFRKIWRMLSEAEAAKAKGGDSAER